MATNRLRNQIIASFNRSVNAVIDLGWDNTGNSPVDSDFDFDEGTLIEVPPGEYLWQDEHAVRDLKNWGIRGTGDSFDSVVFRLPPGKRRTIFRIRGHAENILLENFQLHQGDNWMGSMGITVHCDTNALVKDVHYAGKNPPESKGGTSGLNIYIWNPDGVAILDGVVRDGPTWFVPYPGMPLMIFSGGESAGTLYIRNCHLQNCGEHGVYASRCLGDVRIEHCLFKNNQNTHARISGAGSYVKDSVFVWDEEASADVNKTTLSTSTGLVFESGFRGFAGGLAERCKFISRDSAPNSGHLKVDGSNGWVVVRDCQFVVDTDQPPIRIETPGDSHMIDGKPDAPWNVTLENVHVTFRGNVRKDHDYAVSVFGRDGSVLRDVCIDASEAGPDVVALRVEDGDVSIRGDSAIEGEVSVATLNATASGAWSSEATCAIPSEEWPISNTNTPTGMKMGFPHELLVRPQVKRATTYEFVTSGEISVVKRGDNVAAPESDSAPVGMVYQNDDGTWTAEDIVDNSDDIFEINGDLVWWRTLAGPDPTVTVYGEEIDLDQYRGPNRIDLLAFAERVRAALDELDLDDRSEDE